MDLKHLAHADALIYEPVNETASQWQLYGADDEPRAIAARARLQSDNLAVLKEAALRGMGVCALPLYACRSELDEGLLEAVLPNWRPRKGHLAILFPTRRGMTPAVRAFVEFLKTALPPLVE